MGCRVGSLVEAEQLDDHGLLVLDNDPMMALDNGEAHLGCSRDVSFGERGGGG